MIIRIYLTWCIIYYTDLGMGRMNDAIKYLCESGFFIKGETI